jgi:non-ribosomal peptide synthetase component F
MTPRYGISPADRVSQTFDLTFDLSVFDLFMAWEGGARVCVLMQQDLRNPSSFISGRELTVWFSVPSVALLMKRLRTLRADSLPTLRWSLFCGEPLPTGVAEDWHRAAPQSIVENLYGPTELTIACTVYRWQPSSSRHDGLNGIVPIGEPFPTMRTILLEDGYEESDTDGELLVSGPQVAVGYWNDADRTSKAFVSHPNYPGLRFYRTGDVVRRTHPAGPLCFVGRKDHQVKVLGYRVETGEVEAALRTCTGIDSVAVIPWPITEAGAAGLVAFVGHPVDTGAQVRETLTHLLPSFMVPRHVHFMSELPLTSNGKIDRPALQRLIESGLPS